MHKLHTSQRFRYNTKHCRYQNNELKDNLNEIEGINTLLWKESQQNREKNTIIKNSNKVDKANNTKELETSAKTYRKV